MNTKYWGVFINSTKKLASTKSGVPVLMPTRQMAREYLNVASKGIKNTSKVPAAKVVRVSFNLEQRLHDGKWSPIGG